MKNENNNLSPEKIDKKFLTGALLGFFIGVPTVTASYVAAVCAVDNFNNDTKEENNKYIYEEDSMSNSNNIISYEDLCDKKVITVEDLNGNEKYYIGDGSKFSDKFTDLLTGEEITCSTWNNYTNEKHINLITVEHIENYLVTFDEVKEYYTYDDLVNVLDDIEVFKEEEKQELEEQGYTRTLTK